MKIGKLVSEISSLLQLDGEHSMKESRVFEWRFKGQKDFHDDSRSGQPIKRRTDANVDRVRNLMHSEPRLNV